MKIGAELGINLSLSLTTDMRLAIDMLGMSTQEIEQLIEEELNKNPTIRENDDTKFRIDDASAYEIALNVSASATDFREHLVRQVRENNFSIWAREIAEFIIYSLDERGLLPDHEEIYRLIVEQMGVFEEWIECVRKRLMDLDPLGCGAKNEIEAMMHQAQRLPHVSTQKLQDILNEIKIKSHQYRSIMQVRSDQRLVAQLKTLRSRPAEAFTTVEDHRQTIVPDLMVHRSETQVLRVALLTRPSQRLQRIAAGILSDHKKDRQFWALYQKRARFIIKALRFRDDSLSMIAQAIVDKQRNWFLFRGTIEPLYLKDIAGCTGMSESSVSRLVRGKYLCCDRGVFELKYFFSFGIKDSEGKERSTASIKEHIKIIIAQENKLKPFSDQSIMHELLKHNINISRRTVTKYREELKIFSAAMRMAKTYTESN